MPSSIVERLNFLKIRLCLDFPWPDMEHVTNELAAIEQDLMTLADQMAIERDGYPGKQPYVLVRDASLRDWMARLHS